MYALPASLLLLQQPHADHETLRLLFLCCCRSCGWQLTLHSPGPCMPCLHRCKS
jgi:hypothetical protein